MTIGALSRIIPFLRIGAKAAPAAANATQKMAMSPVFKSGLGKLLFEDMGAKDIAFRLGPDAFFGGMAAIQTPGDIVDKAIAGGTQFAAGGLGGLGAARVAKGLGRGEGAQGIADLVGSYGGDMIGFPVGDALQRAKDKVMGGEGRTAYERMSDEQQQQFADQIRQQTLMGAGLIPGIQDQYTGGFGLS